MEINRFHKKLGGLKSVCIDSSILIYHLEIISPYDILTKALIKSIAEESIFCNISALTVTELLSKPYRLKDHGQVELFEAFISSLPNSRVQPVDYNTAKAAAALRGEYNLRTPDAILLATALTTASDAFITNDISIKKLQIKGLQVIILDEFL